MVCDVLFLLIKDEDKELKKVLRETICSLLSDGKKHHITELKNIDKNASLTNQDSLQTVLKELIAEEYIYMEGSFLYWNFE